MYLSSSSKAELGSYSQTLNNKVFNFQTDLPIQLLSLTSGGNEDHLPSLVFKITLHG
jgi:hypothetical protein